MTLEMFGCNKPSSIREFLGDGCGIGGESVRRQFVLGEATGIDAQCGNRSMRDRMIASLGGKNVYLHSFNEIEESTLQLEIILSSFKDRFTEHSGRLQSQAKQHEEVIELAKRSKAMFEANFKREAERVARPIFEEFVQAAVDSGYAAKVDIARDGDDNEIYGVRLIPIEGASFGTNHSEESVFVLHCRGSVQKILQVMYFDQRPGKNGIKEREYGLPSIDESVIRRELEEFLLLSLKSREIA